jgi:hypothetical protein
MLGAEPVMPLSSFKLKQVEVNTVGSWGWIAWTVLQLPP